MPDKLILYTNPQSRGRVARRMLEELGVPYETKVLEYGENRKPEFLAINPMGKFPTLVHNDVVITENAAIITYLADAFPEKNLAPPLGSTERGTYFRWIFFASGPVEAALTDKYLGLEIKPEMKVSLGYGSPEDVISTLDNFLSNNQYVLGDKFSAADVYLGSLIDFYLQFKMLPQLDSFVRYAELINARPAIIRAGAIDNGLMGKSS